MPPSSSKPAKPAKVAKSARAKPAATPAKAAALKPAPTAEPAAAMVKLKALVDQVATNTGLKKPDAKQAVEATLAALAEALAANATLVAPPLGKLRVVKAVDGALTLKLRLPGNAKPGAKGLADDGEDG